MVTLIGPLSFHEEINVKRFICSGRSCDKYHRHVLKSKHNRKHRCKKWYKCRVRRNGEEDPDVIDVSHILLSTLKIKSPSKVLKSSENFNYTEEIRPKNYLFKMGRRKQKAKIDKASDAVVKNENRGEEACVSAATEQQTKKQTNAFQLLMDSRHKSIGTNSPGKEKTCDQSEMQEILEQKKLKVKRNLALQKMAEAKGYLKRKELEDHKDKCIERQMDKRAERLKNMIKPKNGKTSKELKLSLNEVVEVIEDDSNCNESVTNLDKKDNKKKSKTLLLVDMFMKSDNISPDKKVIPKEDEEFLSKLSPSIRKKENMLSYFKKIDKKSPPQDTLEDNANQSPVLKIKLSSRKNNKTRKKSLSLHKNSISEVLKDLNENSGSNETEPHISDIPESQEIQEKNSKERKKRKRKENVKSIDIEKDDRESVESSLDKDQRPKRNIKRPVKYVDDVQLSSSDEELHIFTPNKKKRSDTDSLHLTKKIPEEVVVVDNTSSMKISTKLKKNLVKEEKIQMKPAKLAPIFAPKPQLNSEQMQAKQKFLYSGVPDQIRKIIAQQKNVTAETGNDFPVLVHVQQNENFLDAATKISLLPLEYSSDDDDVKDSINTENLPFSREFIKLVDLNTSTTNIPMLKNNVTTILQNIKESYPKFPVHRTFRLLKCKSKGEFKESFNTPDLDNSLEDMNSIVDIVNENPDYLNWTDKYKATSTKHLIGNFERTKELKRWLLSWTEIEQRPKNKKGKESDSSDFYDSDSNSRDSFKNNLLILTGPIGCGKTSSVYAVAAELAIKVIEVNASSKRTGKVMLQDLQEATQSHKVNRVGSDNSQKSQEIVETVTTAVIKKRGRPTKLESSLKKVNSKHEILSQSHQNSSQDEVRTGMSLILVDDADIVFDQDDGFSSAIAQLIQCSKRPVILVTGSLTCPHLQRFLQYGKVINMQPLLPKMLGTWLDIMCLAEGACWQGLGTKILDYFKGDIRKSINGLQFYMTAYAQDCLKRDEASQNSISKLGSDDENSNMSWPDSEGTEDKIEKATDATNIVWQHITHKERNLLHLEFPRDMFNVWWNLPCLLNFQSEIPPVNKKQAKKNSIQELETIADVIDSLSLSDYYSCMKPDTSPDITSKPWLSLESNSVSEQDCLEDYNQCHEVTGNILQGLISSSIIEAQKALLCERNFSIQVPNMAAHREKHRMLSRHDNLSNILNPSAVMDRRALALDFWSTCRTVCRIEKTKTDTVSKRNKRFSHYLKSMNVMCRNDSMDSLGDSLLSQERCNSLRGLRPSAALSGCTTRAPARRAVSCNLIDQRCVQRVPPRRTRRGRRNPPRGRRVSV